MIVSGHHTGDSSPVYSWPFHWRLRVGSGLRHAVAQKWQESDGRLPCTFNYLFDGKAHAVSQVKDVAFTAPVQVFTARI